MNGSAPGKVSPGLAVRELGGAPSLLLINGYAASKDDWDPDFLDQLARGSRVLCPDNRGIGQSPPLTGPLRVGAMADDVRALMDALDLERADIAGWSMGGFVAQELAARHPERVTRLIMLSTDGGGPAAVRASDEIVAALTDHAGSPREQASRLIALLFPPNLAPAIDERFGDLVAAARAGLSVDTLLAQEAVIKAWHETPSETRLSRISMPTLIAAGTEDAVIPFANVEVLAQAIPGSRWEAFAGGGHAFMAQEPKRLARLITDWLER